MTHEELEEQVRGLARAAHEQTELSREQSEIVKGLVAELRRINGGLARLDIGLAELKGRVDDIEMGFSRE